MDETWKQLYERIAEDNERGAAGWEYLAAATAGDDPAGAEAAYDHAAEMRRVGERAGRFADLLPDDV